MPRTRTDNGSIDVVVSVDVTVADARTSERAWLQAADVIVGRHRTRRGARRWVTSIRRQFPGCVVAVSRSRHGRWLVLGWPGPTTLVQGGPFDAAESAEVGRLVYQLWVSDRGGRS